MSTDKKLIGVAVLLLILMGVVGAVNEYRDASARGAYLGQDPGAGYGIDNDGFYSNDGVIPSGVVCTMDAKLCPDGSYVGRQGPHCEFAACPEATSMRPGGPLLTGQLVGTVTLGPTCPVEQNPPSSACADKPYQTTVIVSTAGKEVGRQETDAEGRFTFAFLPGTYTVTAVGGAMLPRCAPQTVSLSKAATTTVALSCDTGIR